jgi:uncharacterized membrane-anchored protein YhcB (DUF1043 family)
LSRTNDLGKNKVTTESSFQKGKEIVREDIGEYVAHLQLHMALQARNLLPTLNQNAEGSREELLHQTQVDFEKLISRQAS